MDYSVECPLSALRRLDRRRLIVVGNMHDKMIDRQPVEPRDSTNLARGAHVGLLDNGWSSDLSCGRRTLTASESHVYGLKVSLVQVSTLLRPYGFGAMKQVAFCVVFRGSI